MRENNAGAPSAPDSRAISSVVTAFLDGCRALAEADELIDLAAFLLYASYVSSNVDMLGVSLDPTFSMDSVPERLGNDYVARQLINAYGALDAPRCNLPRVTLSFRGRLDLQRAVAAWASILGGCGVSLEETDGFDVSHAIARALEDAFSANGGRVVGDHASYAPLAKLVARLADVGGRSVCDPACGYGAFLAEASFAGARSLRGSDLDHRAVLRSRLISFFADPLGDAAIEAEDSLMGTGGDLFDRVVCAPPLGIRVDRSERDEYARAIAPLEDGTVPSGPYGEDYFIARVLSSLATGGVAVIHVAPGFLFHQQRSRREYRQALVAQGHISAVIELPGGCAPGTSINSAILVLTKDPSGADVLLVDAASKAVENEGHFEQSRRICVPTEAGIEWLASVVRSRCEIPFVSALVPREKVVATGADLCYATYGDAYTSDMPSRSTADILADIKEGRRKANALDDRIEEILASLIDTVDGDGAH